MLQLRHNARIIELSTSGSLVIGRDEACDLVVRSLLCSRRHAVIGISRDRFVIEDRSTNGTWLCPAQGEPIFLRRDTAVLIGHGTIELGPPLPASAGLEPVVEYRVSSQ